MMASLDIAIVTRSQDLEAKIVLVCVSLGMIPNQADDEDRTMENSVSLTLEAKGALSALSKAMKAQPQNNWRISLSAFPFAQTCQGCAGTVV